MQLISVAHLTSVHTASDVRVVLRECYSLARAGYKVLLIAPGSNASPVHGLEVHGVPLPPHRLARLTQTVWNVYRQAERQNSNIYHLHDPELLPVAILLSRRHKVIFDVHEDTPQQILAKDWIPAWVRPLISALYGKFERFAAARLSAVVTAGDDISNRLAPFNPHVVTIGNYPLLEEFATVPPSDPRRYTSGIVLHPGGINSQSCAESAVRAMELLPPTAGAVLQLAGATRSAGQLARLRSLPGWERVRHLGLIPRQELIDRLYDASIALVLFAPAPNSAHVRSNKLFEAMAAGLPVIGPDFPAWKEFLSAHRCGLAVNPLEPAAIAQAMQYLLNHPGQAAEMGKCGRQAVMERFNWAREEAKLLHLYAEVAGTGAGDQLAA